MEPANNTLCLTSYSARPGTTPNLQGKVSLIGQQDWWKGQRRALLVSRNWLRSPTSFPTDPLLFFALWSPNRSESTTPPGFLCWLHPSEVPCFSSPLLDYSPFLDQSAFPVLQGCLAALTLPTRRLSFCSLRTFSETLSTPPRAALCCHWLSSCLFLPHPFFLSNKGRALSLSLSHP